MNQQVNRSVAVTAIRLLAAGLLVATLSALPLPSSYTHEEKEARGQVVYLEGSSATLFLLKDGRKSPILDPTWVFRNGYNWGDVQARSRSDLDTIPLGAEILEENTIPLDDQLVRSSRDGKVYVVSHGEKRWLLNPDWVAVNGYSWEQLRTVAGLELDRLPSGEPIMYATPEAKEAEARMRRTLGVLLLAIVGMVLLWAAAGRWEYNSYSIAAPMRRMLASRWFWLITFALLLAVRMPSLFIQPRFWAEEGTVWFQYALDHSALKTLVYTFPASGYVNLLPNIGALCAALVARRIDVAYAPLATTLLAAGVQLTCFVLILFARGPIFMPLWRAVCGCCLVLFAPIETHEIWLNTINSMSYLGLIAVLLLLCEPDTWRRPVKWSARLLLVLCGLSGPYAIFLLPAYVLYLWHHRTRERAIQVCLLLGCLAVQGGLVIANRLSGQLPEARISHSSAATAAVNVVHFQIATPILGGSMANVVSRVLGLQDAWDYSGGYPRAPGRDMRLAAWVSLVALIGILLSLVKPKRVEPARYLVLMFLLVAAGTAVGALYSIPSGRYAFLPTIILVFLLLANLDTERTTRFVVVSAAICLYLSNGLLRYRDLGLWSGASPRWADEVRLWRNDHRYSPRVWPSFWKPTVDLGSLFDGPAKLPEPSPVSVSPSAGSGTTARFRLAYREPGGFKALSYVHLLVNSDVKGPGSCWIYYQPSDDTLWLVNDAQTANLGPLRPGSSSTVENGQCVLQGMGSSVRGNGELLIVNVACRFKASFEGTKRLYMNAQNASTMSNWKAMGTWTVAESR